MADNLGINELRVLSTLMGKEKYGLEIIKFVKDETGKELSLGGLYTTLHRLEKKGYVKSRFGEVTAERGGNRRKYYKLTGTGQKILSEAQQSLSPLWNMGVQGA
jgi:PadR family transcriptional regulator, regulatory protein PadR